MRTMLAAVFVCLAGCAAPSSADAIPEADAPPPLPGMDAPAMSGTVPAEVTPPSPAKGARCYRTKPFGAATLATGLDTTADEAGARVASDELTVFFARAAGTAPSSILEASRASTATGWSGAHTLDALASTANDGAPSITGDGLTLFLHSDRASSVGDYDIWVSTRASMLEAWPAPVRVPTLSSGAKDLHPYVRSDGRAVAIASNRSGQYDVYVADVDAHGVVSAPTPIASVDTPAEESFPVLTADGLGLYFSRRGTSQDIWVARRGSVAESFGAPTLVAELSTALDERPSWISDDECIVYFTSNGRAGSIGGNDVYFAVRPQ